MFDFSKLFNQEGFQKVNTAGSKKSHGKKFKSFSKGKSILISAIITLVLGLIIFYFSLPALNFHDKSFYTFLLTLVVIFFVCYFFTSGKVSAENPPTKKQFKVPVIVIGSILALMLLGVLTSAQIFNAARYRDLLPVETGNFTDDVEEITFDQIPMLDKASAEKLGDRKMGELADMVSQFEVADDYVQINYQGRPVRVTPLLYGDIIKWFNNRSEGLPAYLLIDMVTQNVEVMRLEQGIKYSTSEHFGRYLMRHLRFQYPTYMFDTPTFEIDEDAHPYWVCPRIVKRIGLFGGTDISGAVLVDAVTGESTYYDLADIPSWVDRLVNGDLIIEQYDFHGKFVNGYWNSIFGQKGVTMTTSGYNYIAVNDDVYVYTGITSVAKDQSNIGFILVNQRTKEAKYYAIPGAAEYSAMASAEGVVQHLNYKATFPLLLNISGEPTYFIALKDNAALVKMYAMVNVERYQIVATGGSVAECERNYEVMLRENDVDIVVDSDAELSVTNTIEDIRSTVIDGNTYYYFKLNGGSAYYSIAASADENVVILSVGDKVKIYYAESGGSIKAAQSIERVSES